MAGDRHHFETVERGHDLPCRKRPLVVGSKLLLEPQARSVVKSVQATTLRRRMRVHPCSLVSARIYVRPGTREKFVASSAEAVVHPRVPRLPRLHCGSRPDRDRSSQYLRGVGLRGGTVGLSRRGPRFSLVCDHRSGPGCEARRLVLGPSVAAALLRRRDSWYFDRAAVDWRSTGGLQPECLCEVFSRSCSS